jgi:hypothetical protein
MEHTFFKWFLHNRKNDIRRFQNKRQYEWLELKLKLYDSSILSTDIFMSK